MTLLVAGDSGAPSKTPPRIVNDSACHGKVSAFFGDNGRMNSPAFDFDAPVDRRGTGSARWEKYAGRDVIPLWVADTDFRAPPAVLEALAARVAHGVFGYSVVPEELRGLIVERLARLYGWRVSPEWLVFLPGVVPGLHLAARHLAGPQEHVLVPHPIYGHFRKAVQLAPRAASEMPLVLERGRWVFDEDAIGAAVRRESRLLLLCNPQNPGGTIFTRAELARLAQFAERHDLIVCSDEIHCDLLLDAGKAARADREPRARRSRGAR